MRKKFIAVYALMAVLALGSTTLTSCVDDNESASVTAIRDAKAAQLNALAAEANASAKVNEALANLRQANADAINAKTEFEKKEYAARLEKLQAEYNQAIAEAEKKQQDAEQAMQGALMEHQKNLYNNYKAAQGNVTTLSNQIAEKNVEIAQLEAGLISAEAVAVEQILSHRIDSTEWEAKKAAYLAMGENNYEELLKEYNTLTVQLKNQKDVVTAKGNETTAAKKAFNTAKAAFEGDVINGVTIEPTLETGKAIKALQDANLTNLLVSEKQYADPENKQSAKIKVYSLNQAEVITTNADIDQKLIDLNKELGTDKDPAVAQYTYEGTTTTVMGIWTDTNKDGKVNFGEVEDNPTNWSKWSSYLYYENAYKEAKEAYEKASAQDKAQAKVDMDEAEAAMIKQKALTVTKWEEKIAKKEAQKTALKEATDAFTGDTYKAYTDAIAAVLAKEGKAWDDAKKAEDEAKLALAEIRGERNAIDELINPTDGTVINIEEKIALCDKKIAKATERIQQAELLLYSDTANNENDTWQTVLDNAKAELEDLNEELKLAQAAAESWKAQLEASLNGETPSVPETPEEGGEETPAE